MVGMVFGNNMYAAQGCPAMTNATPNSLTTRLGFMKSSAAFVSAALAGGAGAKAGAADCPDPRVYSPQIAHDAPPRNRCPYRGVDWSKVRRVTTTSHGHIEDQWMLERYVAHNFGFYTISNYYPSAPRYPARDFTRNHYRFHTDFPVMVNGRRVEGPFDWNAIIAPWQNELEPKFKAEFPFDPKRDEKMFSHWPEGALEAPNSEHGDFLDDDGRSAANLHLCALGSFFKSGTFDKHYSFKTNKGKYCSSSGEHWRTAADRIIKELMFPDGGGVTINHPTWSNLRREFILEMLDHDPRILGLEAKEGGGRNSERYWDWVLATGRQCYGFFVPDWAVDIRDFGANILLVPELTVHECLKAYRQGNFYGSLHAMDELRFTSLACDGRQVTASTDKEARFEVITARGVVYECRGKSMTWTIPVSNRTSWGSVTAGPEHEVYARVRAHATDGSEEVLFSQAFMLI